MGSGSGRDCEVRTDAMLEVVSGTLKERLWGAIQANVPHEGAPRPALGTETRRGVPVEQLSPNFVAAADAVGVESTPITRGDVTGGTTSALPIVDAIVDGDLERVMHLLVGPGADTNQRNAANWTPLHWALAGIRDRGRLLEVVRKLVEAGADVNAKTAAIGWTPLHLAASRNETGIVEMLLAAGARVNAHSRLGGWTPLQVAEREDARDAAAVLRAAGGKATPQDGLDYVPSYEWGEWPLPRPFQCAPDAARVHYERLYQPPTVLGEIASFAGEGAYAVSGSFTAPGANERLVFETLGFRAYKAEFLRVVSLVDRDGVSRSVMVTDDSMRFERLCRDPLTGTDTMVFKKFYDGACCPWIDTVYMHYDADSGTLTRAFGDRSQVKWTQLLDPSGACWWRAKRDAVSTYEETISALHVGGLADLGDDWNVSGQPISLPIRVIPTETVISALVTLDGLPYDVARVTRVKSGDSGRWKTITVTGGRDTGHDSGGVALVWDGDRKEWRSFYDGYNIEIMGLVGDRLIASAISGKCGTLRLAYRCHFEVDLATFEGQRIYFWEARELVKSAD